MSTAIDVTQIPESFTSLPVRVHNEERQIAEAAAKALQRFQPFLKDSRSYAQGPYGNVHAMCFPDGPVNRAILSAEFILLVWVYDDVIESLPHEAALKEHDAVREVLGSLRQPLSTKEGMTSAFHELGARMITLDPDGAPRVIEAVRQFLSEYDRDGGTFNTIDEYLTFRFLNVAMGMMASFMEWNLNLNLDDAETELCSTYYRLGGDNMALANDYFSWDMEARDVTDRVRNAVPVLMKQFSLGEREAKVLVKGMIVENEQEMRRVALELERGGISVDLKKYIDGMAVMLGGNSFWSATCPRYRLQ